MLGPELTFVDRTYVLYEGRRLLFFGGIDYHRLSCHPIVIETLRDAATRYGLSPSGSRSTTGNHPVYLDLEKAVAEFFGTESAAVFGSGYLSNTVVLQAIHSDYGVFLIDDQAHASITDAVAQFDLEVVRFAHVDPDDLCAKLSRHVLPGERPLVITDGVFPARGEIAPLKAYEEHVLRYNGRILVDDAHGVGVAGPTGKGSPEHERLGPESYVLAGTLSKGFGVYGGIVPGSRELIERIRRDSAAFIGSTSLPIPVAAAAARSVRWLRDNDHLVPELQQTSIELKTRLRALGFDIPDAPTPIVSVTFLDQERNAVLRDRLLAHGVYPPFINYPGAPPGGHFRFALSSAHTDEEIETLYDAIASACD